MHFQTIAVAAMAVLAAAAPSRTEKRTDSQDAANNCSASQSLKCCITVTAGIGIGCVNIDLLAALNPQCGASQKVACCSTGDQTGTVNVGSICPNVL